MNPIFGRVFALFVCMTGPVAASPPCDPSLFRDAVSNASAAINEMHEKNTKLFQAKLQALKAAKGWPDDRFIPMATPYVKDEVTQSLDEANASILAKVQSLGSGDGASTEDGRCAMLSELRSLMGLAVTNTSKKWEHMISKVTASMPPAVEAGAAR